MLFPIIGMMCGAELWVMGLCRLMFSFSLDPCITRRTCPTKSNVTHNQRFQRNENSSRSSHFLAVPSRTIASVAACNRYKTGHTARMPLISEQSRWVPTAVFDYLQLGFATAHLGRCCKQSGLKIALRNEVSDWLIRDVTLFTLSVQQNQQKINT
jgi:hypothetical protein